MAMLTAALLLLVSLGISTTVVAAPHGSHEHKAEHRVEESSTPCNNETASVVTDVYDERQNGSENYRINVNGVVVLLAPAETILAAANLPTFDLDTATKPAKPTHAGSSMLPTMVTPVDPCQGGKCILANSTAKQRGKLKMMNNLLQLFRNLKEETPQA